MKNATILLAAVLMFISISARGAESTGKNCSAMMDQIKDGAAYVGPSNFVVQANNGKEVRLILFLQRPAAEAFSLRWRLIERQGTTLSYCIAGQGKGLQLLADLHLSNPSGRYGMPGSGLSRCAGKPANGLPGSLDIRMWANKELGKSLIYSLPDPASGRDFIAVIAADNTGSWIVLDSDHQNPDDTCYYARGDASGLFQNFVIKK